MKLIFTIVLFVFSLIAILCGYFVTSTFFQTLWINLATSFLSIGIGLVIVNIYLDRSSKKGAVRSLLILSNSAILEVHNRLIELCWAEFGRDVFGKIISEYMDAKGDPQSLKQEDRRKIYEIYKKNVDLKAKILKLEETLTELSRLVGWDLDASLLKACLDSRVAIKDLLSVPVDDSSNAQDKITENLIDADYNSQVVQSILSDIADIKDE